MEQLEILKKIEIQKLISLKWKFLNNTYPYIDYKRYHRTELKEINFINDLKNELYQKLGAIPIFIFLTDFFYKLNIPGPFKNIEKGLLLLYQLLIGKSINAMSSYVKYTTYHDMYKTFYVDYRKELNEWVNNLLLNDYFSNNTLRLIYAKLKNPKLLKHITCYMDGYDSRIVYQDIHFDKNRLYSYKFKNSGLRTQFICDINDIIIYISQPKPCSDYTDGKMFEEINLNKCLHQTDCMLIDGGYTLHVNKVIEKNNLNGGCLSLNNFCYPNRKPKNEVLSPEQINFNKQIGSMRSDIETFFLKYTTLFHRFNKEKAVRITENSIYYIQFKLCSVLYNIKKACEIYDVKEDRNYMFKYWIEENFDYMNVNDNNDENAINKHLFADEYKQHYITEQFKFQESYLINIIQNMSINDNTDSIEIKNTDNNNVNSNDDVDIIDNDVYMEDESNIYEIDYILSHKIVKKKNTYLVKWKNFDETHNSWVKEKDFQDIECIKNYWYSIEDL
jgi:hypothetical protein